MIYNKPYYEALCELAWDGTASQRELEQLARIRRWIAAGKPDLQPGQSLPEKEYDGPEIRITDFMPTDHAGIARFEDDAAKWRKRG